MANYLRVSMQQTILALHSKGWSKRRISREVGINRRTVTKYITQFNSKCTISTTGSVFGTEGVTNSKCTISTAGSEGRKSLCLNYHEFIKKRLLQDFSAQRIYQDLVSERDFSGSYESVKRYARKLNDKFEAPFRRIELPPGVEVQVDYGTGAWLYGKDGKRKKTHLFRIVLSCSRKGYSEVSETQSTESFIRSIENAFRYFGGVPETIVIDNLKAGVLKPCIYDPELNPKLQAFAKHYGTCILPTKVATPRHKGKVESSVKYVQNNALKGRKFSSIQEQNDYLLHWEKTVADTRIHGTVKKQVKKMFIEEKPFLGKLSSTLFPVFTEVKRKVHRDGYVEVAKSFYSVPAEYVRREVWVRYNLRTVRVFNHRMEEITMHSRAEQGRFSTHSYHIPAEKISNPEKGNSWLLKQADCMGGETGAWARAMLKNRKIPGTRVLNGLLQLADKYTSSAINKACGTALEMSVFRLKDLKYYINEAYSAEQLKFDFLEKHPLIRQISDYDNITRSRELFYVEPTTQ
jgi:transposase